MSDVMLTIISLPPISVERFICSHSILRVQWQLTYEPICLWCFGSCFSCVNRNWHC